MDKLTYGVGKMITEMGGCRVLCVYLRGDKQDKHSNYPARNSRFHLAMETHDIRVRKAGREGYAEIVTRIGDSIKGMEDRYFSGPATEREQAILP